MANSARRRKRQRGPGTARQRKERQLGIDKVDGLSKPMLDALHAESGRLFKLGIGVLLQEEKRAREVITSVREMPWYRRWLPSAQITLRRAKAEHRLWDGRLQECANAVAQKHAPGS